MNNKKYLKEVGFFKRIVNRATVGLRQEVQGNAT